jgi:Family of unknown function (DUF6502)
VRPQVSTEEERTAFLEALEESLRPLMRVVFEYGASYQDLVDVVRSLYVKALCERLDSEARPSTASRLGMMLGITKSEIERLVSSVELKERERAAANKRLDQLSLLLGKWHDDSQFSTPYGAPLDLSLQQEGGFRTFDDLIRASGTDLTREAALDALKSSGCAEVHSRKFVRCKSRTLMQVRDVSRVKRLARIGSAIHSHYVYNLFKDKATSPYFERTMVSDFPISDRGSSSFLAQVRQDGEDFVGGLDRWLSNKEQDYRDANGRNFGVMTFYFEVQRESHLASPDAEMAAI